MPNYTTILTGAPITTSADPNGTAPASLTTFQTPPLSTRGDDSCACFLEFDDGTGAVDIFLWDGGTLWINLGTCTITAAKTPSNPVLVPKGALTLFARVTSAVGSPTTLRAEFSAVEPGTVPAASAPLPAGAATAANQATQITAEQTIATKTTAIAANTAIPGSHTAITPSDSTDVTAITSLGLLCTVSGTLSVRGVTTSSTTVSYPVIAGQYVWGAFSRVMLATTATVIGLAP